MMSTKQLRKLENEFYRLKLCHILDFELRSVRMPGYTIETRYYYCLDKFLLREVPDGRHWNYWELAIDEN